MELTLDQALQKGIEAHKTGKAQEADRYYTAILKAQPKHPDANHNMGVLAVGVGKVEEALPFFRTALEVSPKIAQYWLSYIDALVRLDRIVDAKAVLAQAKINGAQGDGFDKIERKLENIAQTKSRQMDEEILQKAVNLRENGEYDRAIDLILHQLKQSPTDPNLLSVLSHCYILNDNLEQAKVYLDAAKDINPNIASVGWNETRLLLKQTKVNEALVIAKKTNKLFPDDVEGMGVLGSCFRADGNFDESLKYLNQAIKLNPNYAEALINRGLVSAAQQDKVNALSDLEKAYQLKPYIKQIWDFIIGLIVETKNYPKAISFLIKMIEVDPNHEKSFSLLAFCNQEADDPALAIMSFEKVLEVRPNHAVMHLNLGLAFMKLDENIKAIETFKKAISLKPDFAEAYINLGNTLNKQGKLDEAIEAYNKALLINPYYAEAYNNIGIALQDQGKLEEAIKAFNKAISIKPDFADACNNIGIVLKKQGKLKGAIEAFNKSLSIKPNNAEAYNNMGLALQDQGKLEGAIEAFNKSLSIKPNNAEAHYNTGNVLKDQGKLEEATDAFNKSLSIKPDHTKAYNNMGLVLKDQGKLEGAIDAFDKAISIKPDNAEAYNNMGLVLQDQGKLEEALEAFKKSLSIMPDYAEAYGNMANAFQDQGKLDEAIEAYSKSLSIKPDLAEVYNNMAVALQDQGKLDEAIKAYKKALSIKPDYAEAWNNLYFPLYALKFKKKSDQKLNTLYPQGISSALGEIRLRLLDYRLNRGHKNIGVYLDNAIKSLSSNENVIIQNQKFKSKINTKVQRLPEKIVALVHFGRSGTGLMHSLIDGHPEVSTLPSIYLSEYFDHSIWEKIISMGWNGMIDRFIEIYEVLFDATSAVPIMSKGMTLIHNIGKKEGMANVGNKKNEILRVDKHLFRKELKSLVACCDKLNAFDFFKLVHIAYDKALNDLNSKSLIFYHIHNPDTYAQVNFARLNPEANWIIMVREPIQSCESWISGTFRENDYFGVVNGILTMLFEIDNSIYYRQNTVGVRLEDLKIKPQKTISALCKWMGIGERDSLYEMTAQGKKWWGDPSSPDYQKDGKEPFGKTAIKRKVGSIFSENDQFILRTLFYPFSVHFGYAEENEEQFKVDLQKIRPMIDEIFDFEGKIAEQVQVSCEKLIGSGSYLYFRSGLIERWNTLNKYQTYPNMIKSLKLETEKAG